MGTEVHLVAIDAPPELLVDAEDRIEDLESRWSRFRSDSELTAINRNSGHWVHVSEATIAVLSAAIDAHRRTGGIFDPTIFGALLAAGYDVSFEQIDADDPRPLDHHAQVRLGCEHIEVDHSAGRVRLPAGIGIDVGGIAKGLAADWIVQELLEAGAAGACANIGGDLRATGRAPDVAGWSIAIGHHAGESEVARAVIDAGGVATTSTAKRAWRRGGHAQHHLIDARTGRPAVTPWVTTTVIAATAAEAEVLAKVVALAPPEDAIRQLAAADATAIATDPSGSSWHFGSARSPAA